MQSYAAAVVAIGVVAALLLVAPALGAERAGGAVTAFPAAGTLTVSGVRVRADPDPDAPVLRLMHEFRRDFRPQEVFAVASRVGSDGQPWYRISIPGRPNGRMGWIPVWAADLQPTVAKVLVHRRSRRIDLYWHGKRVWRAVIAVGAPGMETPLGLRTTTAICRCSRSRRAATRSSPSGRAAASSASTGLPTRRRSARPRPTAASASRRGRRASSAATCRSAPRS